MTIALVDVNSFYCSAEILFKPWLRDRPVAVASNNDGAIVSRNDPAKRLGVKMGQPVFELRDLIARGEIHLFSSNYELYQSLSNRIMAILGEMAPTFVYSVDECFADLSGVKDPEAWGRAARDEIQRRVGMPVGVGISTTKTLAKLANYAAKRWKAKTRCLVDLRATEKREALLRYAPVNEVWGIGRKLSERLADDLKIRTAWELATADPKLLRRRFNVNVERTARELAGIPCFPFVDGTPERRHQIICSRSFGTRLTALADLEAAVAVFVDTASAKLRGQGSLANCLQVFAQTSAFSADYYGNSRIVALPFPTDDTRDLLQAAMAGLRHLYRPGPEYAKAGVMLSQFSKRGTVTDDLFAPKPRENSAALMRVMDAINAKQGRGAIRLARVQPDGNWKMKREFLSPAYTTSWEHLPKARC